MIFTPTRLEDAYLIDVERRADERGFLARTFCEREFADHGLPMRIVQSSTIRDGTLCEAFTTRRRRTARSSWCAARAARSCS